MPGVGEASEVQYICLMCAHVSSPYQHYLTGTEPGIVALIIHLPALPLASDLNK